MLIAAIVMNIDFSSSGPAGGRTAPDAEYDPGVGAVDAAGPLGKLKTAACPVGVTTSAPTSNFVRSARLVERYLKAAASAADPRQSTSDRWRGWLHHHDHDELGDDDDDDHAVERLMRRHMSNYEEAYEQL
eukprot:8604715-Pyramimonas_sp.AAC.1